MNGQVWGGIGKQVIGLIAAQPPFMQIAVVLGVAFCALMILEGLRANFLPKPQPKLPDLPAQKPRRPAPAASLPSLPSDDARPPGFRSAKTGEVRPASTTRTHASPVKRPTKRLNPHRSMRPKIMRRAAQIRDPDFAESEIVPPAELSAPVARDG
jgi:hypothetical protein